ncbi:hypothetical protein GCM10010873_30720 [Cypionkella aquatica]|uniref:Uncharacterized protein n=1 Tax=Cypionkella aquatica TaxID=1756042 RepID=A0AA37X0K5_9RHOB|nr:hypothetical protein [Cypionkella aquatica]GLS88098.1 hypothetical protein GCM10010873_30720 [Cypionkella aquatica]
MTNQNTTCEQPSDQAGYQVPIDRAAGLLQRLALYMPRPNLVVLLFLMRESYRQNTAEVAISTYDVAELTGLSRLTVSASLKQLTALGLLKSKPHYGPSPCVYEVDLDNVELRAEDEYLKLREMFADSSKPSVRKRTRQN